MFFALIFIIYPLGCCYIGWRFLQWLKCFLQLPSSFYWCLWTFLGAMPLLTRITDRIGMPWLERAAIGNWIMAIVYMAVILWLLTDLLWFAGSKWSAIPETLKTIRCQGSFVTAILICLLAYGSWNATKPAITKYELTIDKHVPGLNSMKAVLVSDIHAGRIVGLERLEKLAAAIMELKPDIVFYAGDIIDDDARYANTNNLLAPLAKIKAPFGSYAVVGNHEYIGGQIDAAVALLTQTGMQVLRDEKVLIQGMFYVIGRDDLSAARFQKSARKPLTEIMTDIDKALPVILLDHQPSRLQDAVENAVDLQLSGHTHNGQFFPNNLIVESMYEQAWGYLRKGTMQLVVSCGFGTWGPPIRIGSKAEIVEITIHFNQNTNKTN